MGTIHHESFENDHINLAYDAGAAQSPLGLHPFIGVHCIYAQTPLGLQTFHYVVHCISAQMPLGLKKSPFNYCSIAARAQIHCQGSFQFPISHWGMLPHFVRSLGVLPHFVRSPGVLPHFVRSLGELPRFARSLHPFIGVQLNISIRS